MKKINEKNFGSSFGACKMCATWNRKTEGNEEAKEDECKHF